MRKTWALHQDLPQNSVIIPNCNHSRNNALPLGKPALRASGWSFLMNVLIGHNMNAPSVTILLPFLSPKDTIVNNMVSTDIIQTTARALYQALRSGNPIAPLTDTYEGLSIDDAYDISLAVYAMRKADGETDIGKKIGITSEAVMNMLGVNQPDFGFLTDRMWAKNNIVNTSNMILPRAEAEIAFKLKSGLKSSGVSEDDVLAATEAVSACFEIVDSRVKDWKIKIQDTIADNASCGTMAISPNWVDPRSVDLLGCKTIVTKNGKLLSEGVGAATLGSPLKAVAWLANTLGARGIPLKAGEIILSGSLVPLEPVAAGDKMHVSIDGIGECDVEFT